MNIKINSYEIVSLVIVAVYFKNAAIPYELWETTNMGSTEATIIKLLSYCMVILIAVPLMILYNGLKQEQE